MHDQTIGTPAGLQTDTANVNDTDGNPALIDGQQATVKAKSEAKAAKAALEGFIKPVKWQLNLGKFLAFLSAIAAIAPYIALTQLGETLLSAYQAGVSADPDVVHQEVMFLVFAFLTQICLYFGGLAVTHFADLRLRDLLRGHLLHTIATAPLSWFSDNTAGSVRKAIQDDTVSMHTLVAHAPVESTAAVATPTALIVYAFVLNWRLGILAFVTLPIYGALYFYMMRDMGPKTTIMDTKIAKMSSTAVEFADGIQVVKGFGQVGRAHRRFAQAAQDFCNFFWNWSGTMIKSSSAANTLISVPLLLAINLGGGMALIYGDYANLAQVLTTSLIAMIVPLAIEVIGVNAWGYQLAANAALRIQELTDVKRLPKPAASATPLPKDVNELDVEFKDVSFSYHSEGMQVHAVRNVSLLLPAGSVTALVGPSGSGKSTLATLAARFADPDSGSVLIGGRDIRTIPETELYRMVSFVLQDTHLPRISIRDNIKLACPDASDKAMIKAARDAQILTDIEAMPKGFDTVVGEDVSLSGGQSQRIAIARAILADTPVLILDEATAGTDPDCQVQIQAALNRLVAGRTVLVIAHHGESVRGADLICVMDRGRVAAAGSADQIADNAYWQNLIADGMGNDAE